jgi:hypothetical protein
MAINSFSILYFIHLHENTNKNKKKAIHLFIFFLRNYVFSMNENLIVKVIQLINK